MNSARVNYPASYYLHTPSTLVAMATLIAGFKKAKRFGVKTRTAAANAALRAFPRPRGRSILRGAVCKLELLGL